MTQSTFYAITNDGTLRSSNAVYLTARSGGTLANDTNEAVIGHQFATTYQCQEYFTGFDTSTIPDDDVIDSVVLSLYCETDNSATDCLMYARLRNWGGTLENADWVPGADLSALTLLASKTTTGLSTVAYTDFTSEAAFAANINKTGTTYMVMSTELLEAGTTPATYQRVLFKHSEDGAGLAPRLVVNHSSAGVDPGPQLNVGDAWQKFAGARINIGDTWQNVSGVWVNVGDTWQPAS
jgi:hypothetical protein